MYAVVRRNLVSIGLLAVALLVSALLSSLGMWQLDRAAQKRAAFAEYERRGVAEEVDLNRTSVGDGVALSGYRVAATGHYLGPNILLDNQVHQGRVGYLVYTVFELDGRRQSILVNRGWIRSEADRSSAPRFNTPSANQRLEGRLSQPPAMGLRFEGSELIERLTDDMWRVQGIDFVALSATTAEELLPITMLLDDGAPAGFVRAWTPPGNDEARHLGYAFQWFAMAVAVMVIAVVIMLRSSKADRS